MPEDKVENLVNIHNDLLRVAIDRVSILNESFVSLRVDATLFHFSSRPETREYLGGSNAPLPLYSEADGFDDWMYQFWGRRCFVYLSQLKRGLENAAERSWVTRRGEVSTAYKSVSAMVEKLRKFDYFPHTKIEIEESLREREDIINFHMTYIDSILFSALCLLQRFSLKLDQDVREKLINLVRSEVERYSYNGSGLSQTLKDTSSIWWGLNVLIGEDGRDFRLGDFEGPDNAISFCMRIIRNGDIRYPDKKFLWREATAEIHGESRTCLYTAINCARIVRSLSNSLTEESLTSFSTYIDSQLNSCYDEDVKSHVYKLGLSIEACDEVLSTEILSGNINPSFTNSQHDIIDNDSNGYAKVVRDAINDALSSEKSNKNAVLDWLHDKDNQKNRQLNKVDWNDIPTTVDLFVDEHQFRLYSRQNPEFLNLNDLNLEQRIILWYCLAYPGTTIDRDEFKEKYTYQSNLYDRDEPEFNKLVLDLRIKIGSSIGLKMLKRANKKILPQLDNWSFVWLRHTQQAKDSKLIVG